MCSRKSNRETIKIGRIKSFTIRPCWIFSSLFIHTLIRVRLRMVLLVFRVKRLLLVSFGFVKRPQSGKKSCYEISLKTSSIKQQYSNKGIWRTPTWNLTPVLICVGVIGGEAMSLCFSLSLIFSSRYKKIF